MSPALSIKTLLESDDASEDDSFSAPSSPPSTPRRKAPAYTMDAYPTPEPTPTKTLTTEVTPSSTQLVQIQKDLEREFMSYVSHDSSSSSRRTTTTTMAIATTSYLPTPDSTPTKPRAKIRSAQSQDPDPKTVDHREHDSKPTRHADDKASIAGPSFDGVFPDRNHLFPHENADLKLLNEKFKRQEGVLVQYDAGYARPRTLTGTTMLTWLPRLGTAKLIVAFILEHQLRPSL